jgi:hypothetical protein
MELSDISPDTRRALTARGIEVLGVIGQPRRRHLPFAVLIAAAVCWLLLLLSWVS